MPTIRIEPLGRTIEARNGASLRDTLHAAGILLDYPCGGRGRCGQCRVSISRPGAALSADTGSLACQMVIREDCTVTVAESRLGARVWKQEARNDDIRGRDAAPSCSLRRIRIEMPEPSLQDQRSDWERVEGALEALGARPGPPGPALLDHVAHALRTGSPSGRIAVDALFDDGLLLRLDASHESALGFAVDLGTTTVDIALLDLETGRLLGRRTYLNRQVAFGADVISRAQSFHDNRGPVRDAGLATIQEGAREILAAAGQSARAVLKTVVVGNPIMIHILHGIDPLQLTRLPYAPVASRRLRVNPRDLGWTFQDHGFVETLPLISSYVGADTVGMVVALGLDRETATTLSIDIGTNGEMVLANHGTLLATSTAAGPAFEGAQISCGMRALPGAVVAVSISLDGSLALETVEGAGAQGICGTGLVSALAQLLEREVVDATGRLMDASEIVVPALRHRLFSADGVPAFALTEDRSVYISQKDIRTLQLAKGAVRTGIDTLLSITGIPADGLDALRLAGNFGAGLDARAAMRIGLVPPMELGKVEVAGNAALRGAVMSLLSRENTRRADSAAARAQFIELGSRPEFQARFMEAMLF